MMWCGSLKTIEVHDSNIYFSVYDEVLYSKDKTTLYLYPRQKADLSFVVPDTVTHIDDGAFYDNKYLESVTLSGQTLKHVTNGIEKEVELPSGEYKVFSPSEFIGIGRVENGKLKMTTFLR